jgi:hypothetical protein
MHAKGDLGAYGNFAPFRMIARKPDKVLICIVIFRKPHSVFLSNQSCMTILMKRPNALLPNQMTPAQRRTELCGLLALGLIRLRMRERGEVSDQTGESCLHCLPDQCLHATPTHERNA